MRATEHVRQDARVRVRVMMRGEDEGGRVRMRMMQG